MRLQREISKALYATLQVKSVCGGGGREEEATWLKPFLSPLLLLAIIATTSTSAPWLPSPYYTIAATLNLNDLADSEGDRLKGLKSTNKSLSNLGKVMMVVMP